MSIDDSTLEALYHSYFTAIPNPSHPSKLPKCTQASRPLEEVDGNVEMDGYGPGVKAAAPNKLKRQLSLSGEFKSRSVARRLDFTQQKKT
jgi:cyclin-dependent kinase 7